MGFASGVRLFTVTPDPEWIAALGTAIPASLRMAWDIRLSSAWRNRVVLSGVTSDCEDHSATLILCAHNDLDALQNIWHMWRSQQFPDSWTVQWVVVNDGSTDGTRDWLDSKVASGDPHLTVVHHNKVRPGKKDALALGIKAARHDRLVLTDADCLPGTQWAFDMAKKLGAKGESPQVLLGFSLPEKGSALMAFDALRVAWQYGSQAAKGRAYMGVGRNLAYRGSDWLKIGGFGDHEDLAGGDDDLFVQSAVSRGLHCVPVASKSREKSCPTRPAASLNDAIQRKRRHISTAPRYGNRSRLVLAADAALDPLVVSMAAIGCSGLLHIGGWIPVLSAGLAMTVRSATLSMFARDLSLPRSVGTRAIWLGPLRWGILFGATLSNFTTSPKWTQRAPTKRS